MATADDPLTCDFCGLPVVGALSTPASQRQRSRGNATTLGDAESSNARPVSASEAVYCCLGCRIAAAISQERAETGQARWTLTRLGVAIFFAMNVMVFTMALWSWDVYAIDAGPAMHALRELFRYACLVLSLPVLFLLGGPILESAYRDFWRRRIATDGLLMSGVIAAFAYSALSLWNGYEHIYFEVGCMILVAVTLGRWLEANGKVRATQALRSLRKLLPPVAVVVDVDGEHEVALEDVRPGALVRVLSGQRVPLDGTVEREPVMVDQQIVTGESDVCSKDVGKAIVGGSLLVDGTLYLRVTHPVADGTIQRLIESVTQAALTKSRAVRLADTVVAWFAPFVTLVTLATFVVHYQSNGFEVALLSSLAVVLIACPCALGIATPLATWAAITAAARHQILLRDGDSLAKLAQIRVICFDKTGTLTSGQVAMTGMYVAATTDIVTLQQLTVGLAEHSTHILSRSLTDALSYGETSETTRAPQMTLRDVQSIAGRGIKGRMRTDAFDCDAHLGSVRFMADVGCHLPDELRQQLAQHADESVCCVAWQGEVRGLFVFREQLRSHALAVIEMLRHAGMELRILTGDRLGRGQAIAKETGVQSLAELLPQEKLQAIRNLRDQYGCVAMVGDGVNDAPALAAADVGIALDSGADVARDAADVCLLGGTIQQLPWLVRLATDTRRVVRANLAWAIGYKLIGIGLAATGWLNPILAAVAMVGSSLFVIGNSLRLAAGAEYMNDPVGEGTESTFAMSPSREAESKDEYSDHGHRPRSKVEMPDRRSMKTVP